MRATCKRLNFKLSFPVISSLAVAVTLILIFIYSDSVCVPVKLILPLNNRTILVISAILLAFCLACFAKHTSSFNGEFHAGGQALSKPMLIACISLFFIEIVMCLNLQFVTGWDPGTVYQTAWKLANSIQLDDFDWFYFSRYPNNSLLLSVEFWFIKVASVGCFCLGLEVDYIVPYIILLILNCVMTSVSGLCLMATVSHFFDKKVAWTAWSVFALFAGLSPWLFVAYSDVIGIFFPIFMLYLTMRFQLYRSYRSRLKIVFLIFLTGYFGYRIKPQTVLYLFALLFTSLIHLFRNRRHGAGEQNRRFILGYASASFLGLAIAFLIVGILTAVPIGLLPTDAEASFGMQHYAMMGMNAKSLGVFSQEDVDYSASFELKEDRTKADVQKLVERIDDLGISGVLDLLAKKQLLNFSDGTFCWGKEGGNFENLYYNPASVVGNVLYEVFVLEASGSSAGLSWTCIKTFSQVIWFETLILIALGTIFRKTNLNDGLALDAAACSFLFLMLFEMVFEARARYLISFIPIFIFLASTNFVRVVNWLQYRHDHQSKS